MEFEKHDSPAVDGRFLQTCDIPLEEFKANPFTMIIFGGGGDLSQRKLLPALFHLYADKKLPSEFSILGFGLPEMLDEGYRSFVKEGFDKFLGQPVDENVWLDFSRHLFYLSSDFEVDENYKLLCRRINEINVASSSARKDLIFYLAVPPQHTPLIVERLKEHSLCKEEFNTKVVVEKPFGRDRDSAVKLNAAIGRVFNEKQIYRIDHYLGKDTVQNIMFFRFSNSIFEPLWNRRYIDHVQITVAEDIGIEHRGRFYESVGVVRDIVQNHIMQLLALVAMEPPVGFAADFIRDEKVKIFHTVRAMDNEYIDMFTVRGQYDKGRVGADNVYGYREEDSVSEHSNIPTFFAAKFYIDNWRWAGVPFYVRAGKRLFKRATEIAIEFKQPPLRLFGRTCDMLEPNLLVLSIQPQEEIVLRFGVKYPGGLNQIYSVNMEFNYEKAFNITRHPPYERLIIDCIKGDLTLFARQDGVEAMWTIVDPIVSRWESIPANNFPNYRAGSWGPKEADALMERDGRAWRK
jgi:glucose-6-phosphate 1-dehydrogenase